MGAHDMNSYEYLAYLSKRHKARYELWYVIKDHRHVAEFDILGHELRSSKDTPEEAAEDIIEQLRSVKGITIRYNEKGDQPITGQQGSLFK
jgi:hypothetical protein